MRVLSLFLLRSLCIIRRTVIQESYIFQLRRVANLLGEEACKGRGVGGGGVFLNKYFRCFRHIFKLLGIEHFNCFRHLHHAFGNRTVTKRVYFASKSWPWLAGGGREGGSRRGLVVYFESVTLGLRGCVSFILRVPGISLEN